MHAIICHNCSWKYTCTYNKLRYIWPDRNMKISTFGDPTLLHFYMFFWKWYWDNVSFFFLDRKNNYCEGCYSVHMGQWQNSIFCWYKKLQNIRTICSNIKETMRRQNESSTCKAIAFQNKMIWISPYLKFVETFGTALLKYENIILLQLQSKDQSRVIGVL